MEGNMTDQDLVRQTLVGECHAFEEIVARHQNAIYRIVYHLLKNAAEADDVAQETFIKCYQHLEQYDQERPFTPWLYRIATNLSLSKLRRQQRYHLVPWEDYLQTTDIRQRCHSLPDPEEAWECVETRTEVITALKQLKPLDQAVIILRYFEEFSYEEITYIMGTSRNNVEVRLCRARQRLRILIERAAANREELSQEGRVKLCSRAENCKI